MHPPGIEPGFPTSQAGVLSVGLWVPEKVFYHETMTWLSQTGILRYTIDMDTNQASSTPQNAAQPEVTAEHFANAQRQVDEERRRERNEEKILIAWDAPSRPYRKRDKEFYTTIGIIVFLVSLILFFAGQFLFIAVVVSLAFVAYVLNTVPPDHVHNTVTTFGIHTGDGLFYWEELGRFWFSDSNKSRLLHIETARAFPGVLILLLENVNEEDLKKIMIKYTVFEKPKATWLDNAGKWLQEKFPLEKE